MMSETKKVKWADKEAAVRALEKNGKVDPLDLIEAARVANHPCHGDFTWDIGTAAAERWRDQARWIIRRCKFDVIVEDATEPVVRYVPDAGSDKDVFASLPKMRSVTKVSNVLAAEITMLHGVASRVYGIAIAKQGMVDNSVVVALRMVRDTVAGLVEDE